jgi:hypothetical protein
VFFTTKPPAAFEDIAKGNGWQPTGYGVFLETITLSEDGNSFESSMKYYPFDQAGKPTEGPSEADVEAMRFSS